MKHSQLFIDSLIHPKKLAAYRIMPIGKVIQYVFLLITAITVFSFAQFTSGVTNDTFNISEVTNYMNDIKWLIYPFAFLLLFVMTTLLVFLRISIYALVGKLVLQSMKRRGEYRQIWRTSAFAITWSTIFSVLFTFTNISNTVVTMFSILITMLFIIIAISKFPKLPK